MEQKFPVRNFQKFWVYLTRFSYFKEIWENAVPFTTAKFPEIPLNGKCSTLNNSVMFPGFS